MPVQKVQFRRYRDDAFAPEKSTDGSAAYDLRSVEWCTIYPGDTKKVRTGLNIRIPKGYVGKVCSRSGMALNNIIVLNAPGIIDSDYDGDGPNFDVSVILHRVYDGSQSSGFADHPHYVQRGDKIAQLLIEQTEEIELVETEELNSERTTSRTGGFGSTGS
jgi:dUTP pyrophosphatase